MGTLHNTQGENRMMRRRLRSARLSSIISISMVLLLVGIASLLLLNATRVSDYFKENMQISVLMDTQASDLQAAELASEMDSLHFVKGTQVITKAKGAEEMTALLGEDFLSVFETSPIPASIALTLKAEYVSVDSVAKVKAILEKYPLVDEVDYQKSLISALNANLQKIGIFLGVFVALLLFISFVLISNTVRLSVFSRRFTIHTMKQVGATRAFIRAPFLWRAAFQGLISALIASAMLIGLLYLLRGELAQLFEIFTIDLLLQAIGLVVAAGVVICVVSTYFVVNKLVRMDKDKLYS
jgi:cell division transport system permease protein